MRIDHTALAAEDPVLLSMWYGRWFGMKEEARLENPGRPPVVFLLNAAGQRLEVVPGRPSIWQRESGFAAHVAFTSQDVEMDMKRLCTSGIRIVEQRTTSAGWKIAYFYDPAGNLLELVQRSAQDREDGGQI